MRLLPSLVLSLLASVAGSLLLRQFSAVSTPGDGAAPPVKVGVKVMVLVVPVIGNSGNRLGGRSRPRLRRRTRW